MISFSSSSPVPSASAFVKVLRSFASLIGLTDSVVVVSETARTETMSVMNDTTVLHM